MKKVFKLYLMLFLSITGTVFTTNAETKKILVVGNSFSFDAALQEFLPIVQAAGDDIVLGFHIKEEPHWNFTRIILPQISRYTITTKLKMEK